MHWYADSNGDFVAGAGYTPDLSEPALDHGHYAAQW
jgi:hypothetical protein